MTKCLYVRRKVLSRLNGAVPRELWVGVTYKCQCSCVHCYVGSMLNKSADELTTSELFRLVDSARAAGFLEISCLGGEPLSRPDAVDVIKYASSRGMLTSIYTNGILITREKVRELKEAGLNFCNVSIDSPDPEVHNRLRGQKGCFEKAIDGIGYMREAGIKCSIWTYVGKEDVRDRDCRDLKKIIELGRSLGVAKVVVLFPIASGNWLNSGDNMLTLEERERVRALQDPPFVSLEFPFEDVGCIAGKRMVYVDPGGDVSPCPTMPHFFGNIRQEPLWNILKKIGDGLSGGKAAGCGECLMNKSDFRERAGINPSSGESAGKEKTGVLE